MSYDDQQETHRAHGFRRSSSGKAERHRESLIQLGRYKRQRKEVQRSLHPKKSADPLAMSKGAKR